MKKCIVISDSFKGSLPSRDICAIARERIPLFFPACEVRALNVADGGEGTVDCFLDSCGGERVLVSGVQNPYGEPIDAAYGLLPDGTAVVEMAAAAGLPLVAGRKNPCVTTTYGVGQLIADALARGARRIVLGLGGSATNDGGCGCAAALGVRFTDAGGKSFVPVGATLDRIAHIDASAVRERLHGVRVIAMCDITNPMHGHSGAAHIFAPQKGADEAAVRGLIKTCGAGPRPVRLAYIQDTLSLNTFWASAALAEELSARPDCRVSPESGVFRFDAEGSLVAPGWGPPAALNPTVPRESRS